ncbi:MAG: PQQ-binding-like beta-propeller repeat protein [Halieaceae bacterium]|nr:PQQ-binding-like beta-propeller repeat protein [Halieaceae bacterium]
MIRKFTNLIVTVIISSLVVFGSTQANAKTSEEENAKAKLAAALTAMAQGSKGEVHPGEILYREHCAACHSKPFYKAPNKLFLSMLSPATLYKAMNEGPMRSQAEAIDAPGRVAIAEFLSGKKLGDAPERLLPPVCDARHRFDKDQPPVSVGWGVDLHHTRFQSEAAGGLSAENVSTLEVKWVFAYPNAYQARSEPVYGGGAIYVGSQDGTVWSLDARTGCLRWTYQATSEVRTGIVISQWDAHDAHVEPTIYFGDVLANVYAVDARNGKLRWKLRADDHPYATLTGTPTIYKERLYVPVSSLEVIAPANPQYECCSFRGALLALDAQSGRQLWKSYTTDKAPEPVGKNSVGATILAPSGAPVWSSPTVDKKRGFVYVATGENYSSPADGGSDALIAYDLKTGEKMWVSQQTRHDAWNVACYTGIPGLSSVSCPEENGFDFDFGSSPILATLENGRQVLVGGQKSGDVVGVDPDNGRTLWKTRVGRGGIQGGVHFGLANQGNSIYVPINDLVYPVDDVRYNYKMLPSPGVYSLNAENGKLLWSAPAPDVCGETPFCDRGVSQAITAIPGAVIAGHLDGRLRIYARKDGSVLWEMNMLREYESVSGEIARGGAFSGGGVLVAHGLLYVNAGYGYNNHIPGNALVVLGVRDSPNTL